MSTAASDMVEDLNNTTESKMQAASAQAALGFSQWVYPLVQASQFKIEDLFECLLSEEHNQKYKSFDFFKMALTYLKVEFTKDKEFFFEEGDKPKNRAEIKEEDLVALRIAVENAVWNVLKDETLGTRPDADKIDAVLDTIKTSREQRFRETQIASTLAAKMQNVTGAFQETVDLESGQGDVQVPQALTLYKDGNNVVISNGLQQPAQKNGSSLAKN